MTKIECIRGTENNIIKPGQHNTLHGDPNIKPEKPYTIVAFPGGGVEIARCEDGRYWVHVAVRDGGALVNTRLDASGRYADDANAVLKTEIARGDVEHIAFLIEPPVKG